jgi:membrane carboxypeptidase/penicillin-binding protein
MGEGESGGRVAAPIFRDFMLAALKDQAGMSGSVSRMASS